MSLTQQVQKDMVDAMRKKEELRLSALRMMKAALQNKRIEKRADLDEKEELQVFTTMIKQRKDSIDQFEKGNRPELAAIEAQEIAIIEAYMPKARRRRGDRCHRACRHRRDGLSHNEGHGRGDEECQGQVWRFAGGWQAAERGSEEAISRKVTRTQRSALSIQTIHAVRGGPRCRRKEPQIPRLGLTSSLGMTIQIKSAYSRSPTGYTGVKRQVLSAKC